AASLLRLLFDQVKRPEFQVRWTWKPNSIAFWDNRSTQHYAVNDYVEERYMERVTVTGDRPVGPIPPYNNPPPTITPHPPPTTTTTRQILRPPLLPDAAPIARPTTAIGITNQLSQPSSGMKAIATPISVTIPIRIETMLSMACPTASPAADDNRGTAGRVP